MRKYLLIFAVILLAAAIAAPAFADVQFLYGGQFRFRIQDSDNVFDGTDRAGYYGNFANQSLDALGKPNGYYNSNDNRFYLDQRLRLYFTFLGSKNLKVVTKFEIGDTKWGDPGDGAGSLGVRAGQNGGGNIGADQVAIEVKNVYIEFNVPNTPSTALIGIQTLTLMDSWIIDDDFSAAVLLTKLDPFRIAVGYIGGQYGAERRLGSGVNSLPSSTTNGLSNSYMAYTNDDLNLDDAFISVDYSCGPFKSSLVGFYQDGHKTNNSIDRTTLGTPVSWFTGVTDTGFMPVQTNIKSNDLFDFGFNMTYKVDWLLAYLNFVQNFGSVQYNIPVIESTIGSPNGLPKLQQITQSKYEGFMIDSGVTYFRPPFTFNVGGFYTSGPDFSSNVNSNGNGVPSASATSATNPTPNTGGMPFRGTTDTNVTWFTGPVGTSKYSSEILGGGVLQDDQWVQRGFANGISAAKLNFTGYSALSTIYWETYQYPTNVWTITDGFSWLLCPGTKFSASYWYWGTSEPVPYAYDPSSLVHHAAGTVIGTPTTTRTVTNNASNQIIANTAVATTTATESYASASTYLMSDSIGNEFDFYLDQQIVDNLTLTFVFAYLLANDAFCPLPFSSTFGPSNTTTTTVTTAHNTSTGTNTVTTTTAIAGNPTAIDASKYISAAATNSFKLGARLQWNF